MSSKTSVITKRVAIDKSNTQMVSLLAVASFVTIFCLVAAHALWSQNAYQARVTTAKEKAHQQLLKNIQNYSNLSTSYEKFNTTPNNVIGGQTNGSAQNDGNNAKIILDALPPSYDFPALTSSIEKILTNQNLTVTSISGTDDELNQQTNVSSPNPQPVPMPFMFTVSKASYQSVSQLITTLQQSTRPIQLDSLDLSGGASNMTLTIKAHTYYQPGKTVSITKRVVK